MHPLYSGIVGVIIGGLLVILLELLFPSIVRWLLGLLGTVTPDATTPTECCSNTNHVHVVGDLNHANGVDEYVVAVYAVAVDDLGSVGDTPAGLDPLYEYSGNNKDEQYDLVVDRGTNETGYIVVWGEFRTFARNHHQYNCSGTGTPATPSTSCPTSNPTAPPVE